MMPADERRPPAARLAAGLRRSRFGLDLCARIVADLRADGIAEDLIERAVDDALEVEASSPWFVESRARQLDREQRMAARDGRSS